jgi:tRNA threonylcarbamoyladenosine biosynthesis protein TsaB
MSLLLHIETSVKSCSVALSFEGNLISCVEEHADGFVHAEKLHVFINSLFESSEYSIKQVKAVHISSGPGSFTGLRIGISAAKGICYGLSIPLLQTSSLIVLYNSFKASNPSIKCDYLIPMIDARRMEVYCTVLNLKGSEILPVQSKIIDEISFEDLEQSMVLFGDGADKLEHLNFTNKHITIIKGIKPSASHMVKDGIRLYNEQHFEDLAYFSPNYLKEFANGK